MKTYEEGYEEGYKAGSLAVTEEMLIKRIFPVIGQMIMCNDCPMYEECKPKFECEKNMMKFYKENM